MGGERALERIGKLSLRIERAAGVEGVDALRLRLLVLGDDQAQQAQVGGAVLQGGRGGAEREGIGERNQQNAR